MFKPTNKNQQLDLLSSVTQYFDESVLKIYSDTKRWHNVFFKNVTCQIDETKFKCLFNEKKGAPNSSIRLLIAMMILKDGHGWSDEDLFEQCHFNLLIRKALGLLDFKDKIPSESTYYLLRKRIVEYEKSNKINLFNQIYKDVTKSQILEFEVSGKSVRMDSKLIGSNIAYYSRYELIHKTLLLYLRKTSPESLSHLTAQEKERLEQIKTEDSSKTVYVSSKDVIFDKIINIGYLIYKIISQESQSTKSQEYITLKTVFEQQYKVKEIDEIELLPKEELSAQNIQSPHDTECTFRKKNEEQTKGYNHNLTETCNKESLNLITDIQTEPASAADNSFVIPATNNTQEMFEEKIENVHTDGAYHSQDNQDYMQSNSLNFYATGMQGQASAYDLSPLANKESYIIDNKTKKQIEVHITSKGTYRIDTLKGYRYFTEKDIANSLKRKELENIPVEIKNIRNNVEASIYQLAYRLRKDNTRYRGLIKNTIWAILRCLWINCARITKFIVKNGLNSGQKNNIIVCNYYYLLTIFFFPFHKKISL